MSSIFAVRLFLPRKTERRRHTRYPARRPHMTDDRAGRIDAWTADSAVEMHIYNSQFHILHTIRLQISLFHF